MRKNICITALCFCIGLSSCGNKSEKAESKDSTKTEVKKEKKQEVDPNIFAYTGQHRKDKYQPTEEKITFTKQIGSINEGEFQDNKNIKEVWFGPQIQHVTNAAFKNCTSLEKLHFQGFIPVLNDEAFMGCVKLTSLNMDVSTLGLNCFNGCKSLTNVKFGEHIWWIREGAFKDCSSLRSIIIPITMKKLEDGAFDGCTAMEEFSIPNDVKNRMFGMFPANDKWRKIYLLSTEYYVMPKNCKPSAECTLYVPDAFLEQFRKDENWSKFGKIEPLSTTKYFQANGLNK